MATRRRATTLSTPSSPSLKTDIPVFGICLGHQLLALASGANTVKDEVWPPRW
ncbi:glutamine amidotransferase-related protein [Enterobacter hormaechei]